MTGRMMDHFDIIICGAGPAGSVTAYGLARKRPELRILLLDAESAPRHRPCGEYLSPGAVGILARAGLEQAVLASGAAPLPGTLLSGARGSITITHGRVMGLQPDRPFGLGIRRERFDRVLQDAAAQQVELLRGSRLLHFSRDGAQWKVRLSCPHGERDITACLLVGADGRQSVVRRRSGLDRPVRRKRFALVCRAHGFVHRSRVEMHLGPMGQIGVCPLGDGEVNLNLLLAGPTAALLRQRPLASLMRAALASTPSLAGRVDAMRLSPVLATGSLPQRSRAVIADGICLVGDAGGFCDPFSGEGMTLAMGGAEVLAEQLAEVDFHTRPSAAALAGYASAHAARVGRRHRLGGLLHHILDRRHLADRCVAGLGISRTLGHLFIAGAAAYRR